MVKKPTILLVDDHVIFAEGLRRILESEFQIVGIARDGHTMISEFLKLRPDIVIADICMPRLNGIQAARLLRQREPRARIIFLTMHADPVYAGEALNVGACGYVAKQSAAREVVTAIRHALQGKVYVTPQIPRKGNDTPASPSAEKAPKLTPRQREVLRLIAEGSTAKEIADALRVSHRTVHFHRLRIMEEIGVRTTAELTRFAIKHHVLTR
jgi:DNA-binding NarL/FixJ family response regulator